MVIEFAGMGGGFGVAYFCRGGGGSGPPFFPLTPNSRSANACVSLGHSHCTKSADGHIFSLNRMYTAFTQRDLSMSARAQL